MRRYVPPMQGAWVAFQNRPHDPAAPTDTLRRCRGVTRGKGVFMTNEATGGVSKRSLLMLGALAALATTLLAIVVFLVIKAVAFNVKVKEPGQVMYAVTK